MTKEKKQLHLLSAPDSIKTMVNVPSSKSISNRLLVMRALCNNAFTVLNLSESEDTQVMLRALESESNTIDIGHAGTAMRFLTAFFSISEGEKILTGSERMKQRPIGKLVETLRKLGASIEYLEHEGYPPIKIRGKQINGGTCTIDSSISSQFISALLMIAPKLKKGLELNLVNNPVSMSYIDMTLGLMSDLGIVFVKKENSISIKPQAYISKDIASEGDWTGISYWYQIAALAKEAEIVIPGFFKNSLQGDRNIVEIFKPLGVQTDFTNEGVVLTKIASDKKIFKYDFTNNPDVVQTLAVTLVMKDIPFEFTGTQSLKIKETDRITALQNELAKFGADIRYDDKGKLEWDGKKRTFHNSTETIIIPTYDDHRMAMAFAPVSMMGYNVIIENPEVVVKSYPSYWDELSKAGFEMA